jgi:hypothetical protein
MVKARTVIRGSTPTHFFDSPVSVDNIADYRVSYEQNGEEVVCKKLGDDGCTVFTAESGSTISVTLTQEETFVFKCGNHLYSQVRMLLSDGSVITSDTFALSVTKSINEEVMA